MALRHEELTQALVACIFEVHNELGVGLDEETYHQALFDCFQRKGIPAVSKGRKQLVHRGVDIRKFELDILAFEKIILALKALQCDFLQNHKAMRITDQFLCGITALQDQITLFDVSRMRTYLKYSNIPIGLLVNFGKSNLEIKALHL